MDVKMETVQMAAERLGVSTRTIQNWARDGRLQGAYKAGRDWLIPTDADPGREETVVENAHVLMPLMSSSFVPGKCREFIAAIGDYDERTISEAEYCYFSGQSEKACELTEVYLDSRDDMLRLSARLIYAFASMSLGEIERARDTFYEIRDDLDQAAASANESYRIASAAVAFTAATLLHLPLTEAADVRKVLNRLNGGFKELACYVLAHKAYLEGEYEYSLGMVETSIALSETLYPIPRIYNYLIAAIDLMNLKRPEDAARYFMKAWDMARPDDMIEGFGEHHGLLQGLMETCIRRDEPEIYKRMTDITYRFSSGWRKLHNPATGEKVADNLTTMEFTVAMLACHGWANSDIAEFMQLSVSTVGQHLSSVYNKLGITKREQLKHYMLK